jgi:predicted RNase H-like HicB family nuclease
VLKKSLNRILEMSIVEKQGDWYLATCPTFSLVGAQGKTKKDAIKNLRKVVRIYISALFDLVVTEMIKDADHINGTVHA